MRKISLDLLSSKDKIEIDVFIDSEIKKSAAIREFLKKTMSELAIPFFNEINILIISYFSEFVQINPAYENFLPVSMTDVNANSTTQSSLSSIIFSLVSHSFIKSLSSSPSSVSQSPSQTF
jgi:hypothetical protein